MRFGTFLLRIGGTRDTELDDLKRVCDIGPKTFQPDGQKNLYVIDTCIIDGLRWSCLLSFIFACVVVAL